MSESEHQAKKDVPILLQLSTISQIRKLFALWYLNRWETLFFSKSRYMFHQSGMVLKEAMTNMYNASIPGDFSVKV